MVAKRFVCSKTRGGSVENKLEKSRSNKKHRRDGMSRLGTSRNVQWSAEGVTNSLCSRAQNLVNLCSLR